MMPFAFAPSIRVLSFDIIAVFIGLLIHGGIRSME